MSSNKRSWVVWLFPFLVSGGMTIGAMIGTLTFSDTMSQEGPAGDVAGAAAALVMVINLLAGVVMTMLTLVVAKLLRRGRLDRIALRVGLSVVGGALIGTLGASPGDVTTAAAWILLAGVPVSLAWPPLAPAKTSAHDEVRPA